MAVDVNTASINTTSYPGNLPEWARASIKEIKENAPQVLQARKDDPLAELVSFTNKEEIRTLLALGSEKILQWLKQYAAIVTLEENISIREFMTSWLGGELEEYVSKGLAVRSEEQEDLMELILRQSELLMLYDIFLKAGCTNLKESKLGQRGEMPGLVGISKGRVSYELPPWACKELAKVKEEKCVRTSDEDAELCLAPLLKLPSHLRKNETERVLERGKRQLMKYLRLIKSLRSVELLQPNTHLKKEITCEEMKSMILNKRTANMKKQFLNLFPDLGGKILDAGAQADTEGNESINKTLLKLEEEKRLEEKIDLQDNIIKMDKKLRDYAAYLESTEEIIYRKVRHELPTFNVPDGITDRDPEHYTIIAGRPTSENKFNKAKYLETIKDIFMNNLLGSISEDRAAMTEEQCLIHMDYLVKVLDEVDYYSEAFNIYLYETQEDSMVNTRSCLDIGRLVMVKEAEILESQRILSIVKSCIYSLGGLLKFRRLAQTILYELSPYVWREKYLREKEKVSGDAGEAADEILSHLAAFKSNTLVQDPSLDRLVIFLADTVRNLGPPANYFKSAFQIDLAVRFLELQNLYSFQHLALIIMRQEEEEREQQVLIRSCNCEIKRMETVVEKMRNQLHRKLKTLKSIDRRSQDIVDKYWRIVALNEPFYEAMNLLKEMFEEFIGPRVSSTESPLEMLDILTQDIVSTQMELFELPKKATEELRAFICEKEDMGRESLLKDQREYERTTRLLKSMERTWGPSVGQQGHPPRYRSLPNQDSGVGEVEEATDGVDERMLERLERVLCKTDILVDRLEETGEDAGRSWLRPATDSEEQSVSQDLFID